MWGMIARLDGAGVADYDLRPLLAGGEEVAHRLLGGGQRVVRPPAALDLVGRRHLPGGEDVAEGRFQQWQELLGPHPQHEGVEAGLAAHGGEVDEPVGVVAHELCAQVLDGVHGLHLQVRAVGLAEAHVVLDEHVPAGQLLAVGHAHVGRGDLGVVQVEGLDVHPRRAPRYSQENH